MEFKPKLCEITRICGWCGVEFTPTYSRSAYCSKDCTQARDRVRRNDYDRRRREEAQQARVKACELCKVEYQALLPNQRYCSDPCRERGCLAGNRVAKRDKCAGPQRANDLRQLQSLLGRLEADAEQYKKLLEVYKGMPDSLFDELKNGLLQAIATVQGNPNRFVKDSSCD